MIDHMPRTTRTRTIATLLLIALAGFWVVRPAAAEAGTYVVNSCSDGEGNLVSTGAWEFPVVPGGDVQREHAIRLTVNIAMYVLCSNYKDDQVHAPFLMRRRAGVVFP